MKKIFIIAVIFLILFSFVINIYAQDLKIIDIKGAVFLRQREAIAWMKAKVGDTLYKDYELLTKRNSECTLSFDENLNRVITLKENSHIKISDVILAIIELSKGRVFSLIEKLEKMETFKIKTPTAIAGPRGTGWGLNFIGGISFALCFEGEIYVKGLDKEGKSTTQKDIKEGYGIKVFEGGILGDLFVLTNEDIKEWSKFKENLKDLKEGEPKEEPIFIREQQIREEQREDFRQEIIRELRQKQESSGGEQQQR